MSVKYGSKEPTRWITINGNHVPVYDEGDGEYVNFKGSHISVSKDKKELNVQTKPKEKRVDQEFLTDERIMSEIAGDDSYANSVEYKQLSKEIGENWRLMDEIDEKKKQLEDELKAETSVKPKEEYDDDDEFTALLFGEKAVKKYTEKGMNIKQQVDDLRTHHEQAEENWQKAVDKMKALGKGAREKEYTDYMKNIKVGDINVEPKDDYFGFALNKTTTPYIDEMIEDGRAFIVGMSPKKYIQECAFSIFERDNSTIESTIRGRSSKDVAKYMTMMEQGVKFDTPYLNYKDKQQEGLHRAIAAYMLGIEEMPVVIVSGRR